MRYGGSLAHPLNQCMSLRAKRLEGWGFRPHMLTVRGAFLSWKINHSLLAPLTFGGDF